MKARTLARKAAGAVLVSIPVSFVLYPLVTRYGFLVTLGTIAASSSGAVVAFLGLNLLVSPDRNYWQRRQAERSVVKAAKRACPPGENPRTYPFDELDRLHAAVEVLRVLEKR